jgi:glutamine amidotransferase/cyclase
MRAHQTPYLAVRYDENGKCLKPSASRAITYYWRCCRLSRLPVPASEAKVYFVHSFRADRSAENADWVLTTTNYGDDIEFVSAVQKGNVMATQFHPEKSGAVGIAILQGFLESLGSMPDHDEPIPDAASAPRTTLSKRVIA